MMGSYLREINVQNALEYSIKYLNEFLLPFLFFETNILLTLMSSILFIALFL